MKRTSRRTFGKQIASALVTVPVTAVLNGKSVDAQQGKKGVVPPTNKPATSYKDDIRNSHDTPPPVLIGTGSFLVEKKKAFLGSEIITTGNRKQHHINPEGMGNNKILPRHIKVLAGSGEILYRNDNAKDCVITFAVNDGSGGMTNVTAAASPPGGKQTFIIETDADKELEDTGVKPTAAKRGIRLRLKDGNKDFSIVSVKIVDPTDLLYQVKLQNLPENGDDFKVMIWLEEEP